MVEDLKLPVTRRERTGSAESRRLRLAGRIPVNLYGLGQPSQSLSAGRDIVEQLVATRSSVVDVELDGQVSKAVVQELQWDVFTTVVQHVDLKLVDPEGQATVDVPVELRGEPAALKEGGVLRQPRKKVRITCPDYRIPKSIQVRIGSLGLGESIKAGHLRLPETATLETPGDEVIVELVDPRKSGD